MPCRDSRGLTENTMHLQAALITALTVLVLVFATALVGAR